VQVSVDLHPCYQGPAAGCTPSVVSDHVFGG
jgi:hypothetical protein